MLFPQQATREVSLHLTTADARLIVACIYMAQTVEKLGLSSDQANRAGLITSAIHGAIARAIRQSRDSPIPSPYD